MIILQPRMCKHIRFGLFPFRSPLLRKCRSYEHFFLFLLVLRCFTSQGALSKSLVWNYRGLLYRVSPFGDLRIKGYRHLPEAYRSLSRPSSPFKVKASTICSYFLSGNLKTTVVVILRNRFHRILNHSFLGRKRPQNGCPESDLLLSKNTRGSISQSIFKVKGKLLLFYCDL